MRQPFKDRPAQIRLFVEDEFEIPGERGRDSGAAQFAVALRLVRIAPEKNARSTATG
jgi:hypothetical protein